MKPIFKVLTSPFRSSKSKKSIKQQKEEDNVSNQINDLQNNINSQQVVSKDSAKFKDLYSQIQKMVDQLGGMLHLKQKMTETQKRQLINELSSMALNQKKMGNLFDEDVLESDGDDDSNQLQTSKQPKNLQESCKQTPEDAFTRSNSYDKSETSPKSQQSPQKKLQELFQNFEQEQQGISEQKDKTSTSDLKGSQKGGSLSTFSEIKSQMSNFFFKNSSKVLKLMKPKKEQKSAKNKKVSHAQQEEMPQIMTNLTYKKKKSSIISSIFPSWNAKKQQKTLNSTAAISATENTKVIEDENQQQNYQKDIEIEREKSRMQFSIDG